MKKVLYCVGMSIFFLAIFLGAAFAAEYGARELTRSVEGISCIQGAIVTEDQARQSAKVNAIDKAYDELGVYIKATTKSEFGMIVGNTTETIKSAQVICHNDPAPDYKIFNNDTGASCVKGQFTLIIIPSDKTNDMLESERFMNDPFEPLNIRVRTNKKDNRFKHGEEVKIVVKGNKEFYLYMQSVNPLGKDTLLLPNDYRSDNRFDGGKSYIIPASKKEFKITAECEKEGECGDEKILITACNIPAKDIIGNKTRGINKIEGSNLYQIDSKTDMLNYVRTLKVNAPDADSKKEEPLVRECVNKTLTIYTSK